MKCKGSGRLGLLAAGALVLGAWLAGCETSSLLPEPEFRQYFPLRSGMAWEYRIDSIQYRETLPTDTQRWLVRMAVGEEITDLEGQQAFPIEVYRRRDTAAAWNYLRTDQARLTQGRAEWVENNLRYIRLVFPVREGGRWDGHAFLSDLSSVPVSEQCNNYRFLENWNFRYEEAHRVFVLDGLPLDSTVLVVQQGEQNLIEYNEARERYAAGLGLIWRRFDHLTTQNLCPECPWTEKVECGFSVEQWLVGWEE